MYLTVASYTCSLRVIGVDAPSLGKLTFTARSAANAFLDYFLLTLRNDEVFDLPSRLASIMVEMRAEFWCPRDRRDAHRWPMECEGRWRQAHLSLEVSPPKITSLIIAALVLRRHRLEEVPIVLI
jgi:hypothetical protein